MKNLNQKLAELVAKQQEIEKKIAEEQKELCEALGEILMRAMTNSPAFVAHPVVQQAYSTAPARMKKLVAAWLETLPKPAQEASA